MKSLANDVRSLIGTMIEEAQTDLTGLARKAGVAHTTLTRFVNNPTVKHIPTLRTLMKLSEASGVSISLVRPPKASVPEELAKQVAAAITAQLPDPISAVEWKLLEGFRALETPRREELLVIIGGFLGAQRSMAKRMNDKRRGDGNPKEEAKAKGKAHRERARATGNGQ